MKQLGWYALQISIIGGVVAFYEVFVFVDKPIQIAPVLIIGVFLAIVATAVVYWAMEGIKALARQRQLPLSTEQASPDHRSSGREPLQGRRHKLIRQEPTARR